MKTVSLRSSWVSITSLVLLGPLLACGGDDGGECVAVDPCGGDISGSWTVENLCGSGTLALPTCDEGAEVDFSGLEIAGTLTFNADGTYAADLTTGGELRFRFPAACLPEGATCDDMASDELICTESGSGCLCTVGANEGTSEEAGTWETSGNTVTIVSDAKEPSTTGYCVEDDVLTLRLSDEELDLEVAYVLNRN